MSLRTYDKENAKAKIYSIKAKRENVDETKNRKRYSIPFDIMNTFMYREN